VEIGVDKLIADVILLGAECEIENNSKKVIPKTIHYCWFGKGAMPELVLECIDSWKKFLPSYDVAAEELKKVDWSRQPDSVKRTYKTPIWMLKAKRLVMKWGSAVKQALVKRLV
jgi:mannosyltransferase OCH1-like enzyme